MAAPAWESTGTQYATSSQTTTHAVPVPSGVAANNVIVISMIIEATATISGMAAGFSHAPSSPVAAYDSTHSLCTLWKRATGNDTGTYDFNTSASVHVAANAIRYSGAAASGNPFDTAGGGDTPTGSHDSNESPAVNITTLGTDRMLVFSATNFGGGIDFEPPSAGGTWNQRFDEGDHLHAAFDKTQAAAGNTGSVTSQSQNGGTMNAWIGALKPVGSEEGPAVAWLTA